MSIRRQLALCIGLLMLLIMSGNLVINVLQLQSNYEQQLKARADETATTLALSMSHSALLEPSYAPWWMWYLIVATLRKFVLIIWIRIAPWCVMPSKTWRPMCLSGLKTG